MLDIFFMESIMLSNLHFDMPSLLPQAIARKITINYNQDKAELTSEFTAAISIADENSGNLEGTGDARLQSTTGDSMYVLQDVPGKGKGFVTIRKISKSTRVFSKRPLLLSANQSAASSFEHSSARKLKPLAKISGETSYPCTILIYSISGFSE